MSRNSQIETDFLIFQNKLLKAEESAHFSGKNLYSHEALKEILGEYCNIIVDDIRAQSCTIQLKLHDLKSSSYLDRLSKDESRDVIGNEIEESARKVWDRTARKFSQRWDRARDKREGEYVKQRDKILRSPMQFPYAIYPKGAMWLAASNDASPWKAFVGWHMTDLESGITAEIVQGRAARVRDPLSMRSSRAFRKLGEIDPYLWTNQGWMPTRPNQVAGLPGKAIPLHFLTFYSVPIRIHTGGDVIGTIKVENKGVLAPGEDNPLHAVLDAPLASTPERMLEILDEAIKLTEKAFEEARFEPRERSKMSLAYLAYDLANNAVQRKTTRDLLTATYLNNREEPLQKVPPVQVLFDSIKVEEDFFDWIEKSAGQFYCGLMKTFIHSESSRFLEEDLEESVQSSLGGSFKVTVTKSYRLDIPDFVRMVSVEKTTDKSVKVFHVQACPTTDEVQDVDILARRYGLKPERARLYRDLHGDSKADLAGETIVDSGGVIYLPVDRLAARIVAFTSAVPVPTFQAEDALKLSHAAVEVGKLIERQISYRGAHTSPTVPLTADDFYRIAISDLSFVDAVQKQYQQAEAAKKSLAYHLPNLCRDLKFEHGVHFSERIKSFRSYFERIGQAHRANVNSLIALWSYLLYRKVKEVLNCPLFSDVGEDAHRIGKSLEQMKVAFEKFWAEVAQDDRDQDRYHMWVQSLDAILMNDSVYPDLRFGTPPFATLTKTDALIELADRLRTSPGGLAVENPLAPIKKLLSRSEISRLLFRRYDPFIEASLSLYLQLQNNNVLPEYADFYRRTKWVLDKIRDHLEAAEERVGRIRSQDTTPTDSIVDAIGDIRLSALPYSTREVMQFVYPDREAELGVADEDYLTFSIRGIYKRLRTLVTISSNQTAPSILNWGNTRFDYLGSRITCLFKNQIFATYEELWQRGDPFLALNDRKLPPGTRRRWLGLRTKVHTGKEGYSAWQISALMDSEALNDQYWEDKRQYNLNSLSEILASEHRKWSTKNSIKRYRKQANARDECKRVYSEDLSQAMDTLDQKTQTSSKPTFGQYLGRSAMDVLVYVLQNAEISSDDLMKAIRLMKTFSNEAAFYSENVIRRKLRGKVRGRDNREKLIDAAGSLYDIASTLVRQCRDDKRLRGQESGLIKEQDQITADIAPHVFVEEDVRMEIESLAAFAEELLMSGQISEAAQHFLQGRLESAIRRLQQGQMDYLFDLDVTGHAPSMRGQEEVMDRVLCYVLLREDAYNLYYYLMSLVPVEIQVRTALADTMAEQYHKIYKAGADRLTTSELQQDRLKEIAQELEEIDREMEVQFEDFIAHR